MARYTSLYRSGIFPVAQLRQCLSELLESCNFAVIYEDSDYLVARERPGGVAFSKLVTVEVLFGDRGDMETSSGEDALKMNVVVKNEELPLTVNNHCRQQFNLVTQVVSSRHGLQLIEGAA
ncbi:MAG: hypothetical protein F6K29_33495 [Okeania sp. SIO2G5]|nr:hypothetical protein [Okeania sp. SIO2G5]